jgi:antitoxin (DNA-binding transcriptional repressor) of toxin-antitoxin stability system
MPTVIVDAFKADLQPLLDRIEAGEEVILARGDRPVARFVPIQRSTAKRHFGAMRGIISVGPAFFEPLPTAEQAAWEQ